jgi:membrane protease YdiL (CAAX protease family)
VLVVLATFAGLFIGAMTAAAALHGRGPGTLFGPWRDWRRGFLTALGVMAPVYAALVGLALAVDAPEANLPPRTWLVLLPLTLMLLFVQTGAEELFFRGYLQQQLAARFHARWVWFWIPAVAFALLHWNPVAGANLPLVLLAALTFGLVAADLTERTGSLGAAMGLHLGNNFTGIAIIANAETISGLALWVSDADLSEPGLQSLGMALNVAMLVAVWGAIVWILDR